MCCLGSVALAAVASCEGSCRYALKLLVLMEEEGISPDRFSLTAVGELSLLSVARLNYYFR